MIYDYELLNTIQSYRTIYLNDGSLHDVVNRINNSNVRETVDNKTHLQNLRTAANEVNNKIASGICPKCGGKLVARNGKYGQFWRPYAKSGLLSDIHETLCKMKKSCRSNS